MPNPGTDTCRLNNYAHTVNVDYQSAKKSLRNLRVSCPAQSSNPNQHNAHEYLQQLGTEWPQRFFDPIQRCPIRFPLWNPLTVLQSLPGTHAGTGGEQGDACASINAIRSELLDMDHCRRIARVKLPHLSCTNVRFEQPHRLGGEKYTVHFANRAFLGEGSN